MFSCRCALMVCFVFALCFALALLCLALALGPVRCFALGFLEPPFCFALALGPMLCFALLCFCSLRVSFWVLWLVVFVFGLCFALICLCFAFGPGFCLSAVPLFAPLVCLLVLPAFLLLVLPVVFLPFVLYARFCYLLTCTPALAGGLVGSSLSTPGFTLG